VVNSVPRHRQLKQEMVWPVTSDMEKVMLVRDRSRGQRQSKRSELAWGDWSHTVGVNKQSMPAIHLYLHLVILVTAVIHEP
jgi:hypothetical protein